MKLNILLPGNTFTQRNIQSLLKLTRVLKADPDIDYEIFWHYSSDIYLCRNTIIQKKNEQGQTIPSMIPFNGDDYDYMLWIDSDVEYRPEDVYLLLGDKKDIVSGMVPIGTDNRVAVGQYILSPEGDPGIGYIDGRYTYTELMEVDFCGFAFVLIKKGVFETIRYPWFQTIRFEHAGHSLFLSEDVGFCYRAKEAGFSIWADPRVRPGHEKSLVMRCGGNN